MAGVFDGHLDHFGGDFVPEVWILCGPRRPRFHSVDRACGPSRDRAHGVGCGGDCHQPKGRRWWCLLHDFEVVWPEYWRCHRFGLVPLSSHQCGVLCDRIHCGVPRFVVVGRCGPWHPHRAHVGEPRGDVFAHRPDDRERCGPWGQSALLGGGAVVRGFGDVLCGKRTGQPRFESCGHHRRDLAGT